ncbi:MAG: D-alanine--D-alanine ligase [Chlamydiia bacterium]|nr:D-alanine--D-alanine ligase [Chlamydiia bacterium]
MQSRIRVGCLFGGQSPEHEVSVRSAQSILSQLDRQKYEVIPIKIDKNGTWYFLEEQESFPGESLFSPCTLSQYLDVIFPILHGPNGEDGTVQGLARLANLPIVGPDCLSSAMCMDKGIMKELLKGAALPIPKYQVLHFTDAIEIADILSTFAFPLFVKPAAHGSSVGISKVKKEEELLPALEEAFTYDERVLIEEGIEGREIECSVLGNLNPKVSLPGEVIPTHEFYTYEAKYLDENGAFFELPAALPEKVTQELQSLAIAAFKTLRCEGMARIDFFLEKSSGRLLINELNTIPGFTSTSLYPKLWEISGIPYSTLLSELIDLAIERHHRLKQRGIRACHQLKQAKAAKCN